MYIAQTHKIMKIWGNDLTFDPKTFLSSMTERTSLWHHLGENGGSTVHNLLTTQKQLPRVSRGAFFVLASILLASYFPICIFSFAFFLFKHLDKVCKNYKTLNLRIIFQNTSSAQQNFRGAWSLKGRDRWGKVGTVWENHLEEVWEGTSLSRGLWGQCQSELNWKSLKPQLIKIYLHTQNSLQLRLVRQDQMPGNFHLNVIFKDWEIFRLYIFHTQEIEFPFV